MKYLLGFALAVLLLPGLAVADGLEPNSVYLLGPDGNPAWMMPTSALQPMSANGLYLYDSTGIFSAVVPFDGGKLGYTFISVTIGLNDPTAKGHIVDGSIDALGWLTGVDEYPPGFVEDPNKAPIDQWPFDIGFAPLDIGGGVLFERVLGGYDFVPGDYGSVIVTGDAITAPEPSTRLLLGVSFLLTFVALRRRMA